MDTVTIAITLPVRGTAYDYQAALVDALGKCNGDGMKAAALGGLLSTILAPSPTIDLDAFIRENGISRVDLLKMNIEGAEELAIKGMSNIIKQVNHVVIACHDFKEGHAGTKKPVIEFLKQNGFDVFQRPDDPRHYVRDHIHGRRLISQGDRP